MPLSINVNDLTVVHQGSNGLATAAAPDVCNTPSPSGPVPLPYPNIARASDLVLGSMTVITNGMSAAVKDCMFAMSTGDEPGTAGGGVMSFLIKGPAKFVNYSFDVKFEGRNVARLTDAMTMNGNAPNTTTPAECQEALKVLVGEENLAMLCKAFCRCNSGGNPDDIVEYYDPNRIA